MTFEIWDEDTGNLLTTRPTKGEALIVVRDAMAKHGEEYINSLALISAEDGGELHIVAEGKDLAILVAADRCRSKGENSCLAGR